ncbi:MAG: ABC transporter permease [Lachnospiraceae bacterium]|nr:ABC transporter permease [Lachnospiraceae bacterium]
MKSQVKKFGSTLIKGNKAVLMVAILAVALSFLSPIFLTRVNLLNVLRQVCVSTIIGCGFTMVLGSGNIDLSVGSTVGFTSIVMAKAMVAGVPVSVSILLGVITGIIIGIINAGIIIYFKLPPFIVTLAMMQVLRGSCYLTTGMLPVTNVPKEFSWLGQGSVLGIPVPIYIMLLMVVVIWIVVNRTKFGRYLLAIGGNEEAARVSGVNVEKVKIGVFATMGACSALAGMVMSARASSAQPSGGLNMEMDCIAAVVVGGTSMQGGSVNVVGAFFGCLVVGIINNGLNLMGVDSNWQVVAKGLLILFAVILDSVSQKVYGKAR